MSTIDRATGKALFVDLHEGKLTLPLLRAIGKRPALLSEVEAARAVYVADLGIDTTLPRACQHPGNVWSLHGYHECLTRLGRHEEASQIKPQLDRALAGADVEITSSCFCRIQDQALA